MKVIDIIFHILNQNPYYLPTGTQVHQTDAGNDQTGESAHEPPAHSSNVGESIQLLPVVSVEVGVAGMFAADKQVEVVVPEVQAVLEPHMQVALVQMLLSVAPQMPVATVPQ